MSKLRTYLCSLVIFMSMVGAAWAADVTVTVTNTINNRGHLLASLCDKEGFPAKCTQRMRVAAVKGAVVLSFKGVPPGTYAITVIHDENDDGKLSFDAAGIPIEGYGFSRDAIGRRGPPKFEDAALTVEEGANAFDITLVY